MLNVLQFSVIIDDAILVDESDEKSNAIRIYGFFIDFLYSICHIQTTCISLSTVFFSVVSGWDLEKKDICSNIFISCCHRVQPIWESHYKLLRYKILSA